MKLDHCHRASCVQIIEQLRTTITEQQARIAQLEEVLKGARGELVASLPFQGSFPSMNYFRTELINKINEVIGS